MRVHIVASARKHGIQDSDINHAVRHAHLGEMKTTNDSKNANTDFKEMPDEEIEALRQRWLSGIPEADDEPCSFCLWMEQVEYKEQKKSLQP
jgi:hypothetical protein